MQFLKSTKPMKDTSLIYQDIVDDVFNKEITGIASSSDMVHNLNLNKDIVTQKTLLIQMGI